MCSSEHRASAIDRIERIPERDDRQNEISSGDINSGVKNGATESHPDAKRIVPIAGRSSRQEAPRRMLAGGPSSHDSWDIILPSFSLRCQSAEVGGFIGVCLCQAHRVLRRVLLNQLRVH